MSQVYSLKHRATKDQTDNETTFRKWTVGPIPTFSPWAVIARDLICLDEPTRLFSPSPFVGHRIDLSAFVGACPVLFMPGVWTNLKSLDQPKN